MHKKIRHSVFETNSSSSHSITISNDNSQDLMDMIYPTDDDIIILTGGEFGWEWEKYNDALTKANYAAQSGYKPDMLKSVIEEHTGYKTIIELNGGYIDHNSDHVTAEAFKTNETLRQFIFNKKSMLFLGNDNSRPPNGFYDPEGTVYTYLLKLYVQDEVYTWKCKDDVFEDRNLIDVISDCFSKNLPQRYVDGNHGIFYDFKSHLPMQEIALKQGYVVLHRDDLLDIARKECPKDLSGDIAWKWTVQKTHSLIDNSDYQLKVKVELIEIQ